MNGRKLAATILVPFVAIACAEQGQQGQQGQTAEEDTPAAEQEAPAQTEQADQAANRVQLASKDQSGISGTAGWSVEGDSARFTLRLKGVDSGQEYPAHVHDGNCDEGGGVAVGLNPVAGGEGGGTAEAAVARSNFSTGQTYFVQVHLPDGTPAACGDLPKDAGLAPGGGQGQM